MSTAPSPARAVQLGLRQNLPQFVLLVAINALVGAMLGQERTVLPLLARAAFGLDAFTATLTFIAVFGITKALSNAVAGSLADRYGRRPVLLAGWLVGLPVPLMIAWAPSWDWIIAANVLLGINQGLAWSATVIMKIDLAGPARRGLAMGINEASGYGAVALTAVGTGWIAANFGLRPEPFLLGFAVAAIGLGLSLTVRETRGHAALEAAGQPSGPPMSTRHVFRLMSWRDRTLSSASQAGLVNNLNDGVAWGLFPLHFAAAGLSVGAIGVLVALYPAVWGVGQLFVGGLSDRLGRKWLIVGGMATQGVALLLVALSSRFAVWALAMTLLGAGTAMVYPTLLAAISDVAHPSWRARAVGVYRLWRDSGFAVGALVGGLVADAFDLPRAIIVVAALTGASAVVVAARMHETLPR